MAEVFAISGENTNNIVVPPPQLQGVFIPGIDNPLAVNGFGLVTPFGGGSTTRKHSEFGLPAEVSSQSTQLNDLMNAFVPGGVGGVGYNLEGLVGPQGIAGINGIDGVTTLLHLYGAPNSNFLTALPHNLDLINDLGTAADKLIYTDGLTTYGGSTEWTERRPAGAADKYWTGVASDSDGSNLIACVGVGASGRLYTSADYGVSWSERRPGGDNDLDWVGVASDSDGSHLIAAIKNGRLYTSNNYGASWTELQPAGDNDIEWSSVASDVDGSNLIVCVTNGRLYTSADYGANWTERQPDDADDNYWTSVASDDDGSVLIAGKGNTTVAALYISVNSGVSWSEEIPAAATTSWMGTASDADGSNLIAGGLTGRLAISDDSGSSWTLKGAAGGDDWHGVSTNSDGSYVIVCGGGHVYESFDSGVTFAETKPAGATTKNWRTVATAKEGSSTIVAVYGGRLYTGSISVGYSEATWAESALTSAGRALVDDADAAAQATTLGLGTGDSPTWVGATLSGLTQGSVLFAGVGAGISEDNTKLNWDDTLNRLDITSTLRIKNSSGDAVFYVDDDEMYFTASLVIPIEAGMPIGLSLIFTYASP